MNHRLLFLAGLGIGFGAGVSAENLVVTEPQLRLAAETMGELRSGLEFEHSRRLEAEARLDALRRDVMAGNRDPNRLRHHVEVIGRDGNPIGHNIPPQTLPTEPNEK